MLLQLPEQKLHSHLVMALHAYSPRPHRAACQWDHKQSKVTEQYVPELLCVRGGFGSCDTPPTSLHVFSLSVQYTERIWVATLKMLWWVQLHGGGAIRGRNAGL